MLWAAGKNEKGEDWLSRQDNLQGRLPKLIELTFGDDRQKQNRLCNDAADPILNAIISINWGRRGGIRLGNVRGGGEERSEEIHWCWCVCDSRVEGC